MCDGISGVQFTLEWDASVLDLEDFQRHAGTTEVKVTALWLISITIPGVGTFDVPAPFFEARPTSIWTL